MRDMMREGGDAAIRMSSGLLRRLLHGQHQTPGAAPGHHSDHEIRGHSLGHDDFGVFGEFVKLSESLECSLELTMVDLETVWKYFLDVFFQF